MKATVQTDLRLEMALESMWIVCAHEKSNNCETTENKRACASNYTLTSTSLSLHKSGSTGLFHTSTCRKHFDFLKVERFRILLHTIKDLLTSAISSTICGTGISMICSDCPGFPTHTTHTKSSSRSTACARFSTTLHQPWIHSTKSLHGFAQIGFALH